MRGCQAATKTSPGTSKCTLVYSYLQLALTEPRESATSSGFLPQEGFENLGEWENGGPSVSVWRLVQAKRQTVFRCILYVRPFGLYGPPLPSQATPQHAGRITRAQQLGCSWLKITPSKHEVMTVRLYTYPSSGSTTYL